MMSTGIIFSLALLISISSSLAGYCNGPFNAGDRLDEFDGLDGKQTCYDSRARYCRKTKPGNPLIVRECQSCYKTNPRSDTNGFPNLHGDTYCQARQARSTNIEVRNAPLNQVECHEDDRLGRIKGACTIPNDSNDIVGGQLRCVGFEYQGEGAGKNRNPEMKILYNWVGGNRYNDEIHYHLDKNTLGVQTAQVKKIGGHITNKITYPVTPWAKSDGTTLDQNLIGKLYRECQTAVRKEGLWSYGNGNRHFFQFKGNSRRPAEEAVLDIHRYIAF